MPRKTLRNSCRGLACILALALAASGPWSGHPAALAQVGANDALVNPNLATEEELGAVAQLDEEAVAAILEGRPFLRIGDLHAALTAHVDETDFEALYGKLWVPMNLNTASDEEILLIPGVGPRMRHEFEEYRPYAALAQFHREIGKYVDDDELARLAQYVFVPIELNTATPEAILSIPGVGDRMLHEFEEYRPYRSLEQFRREIGKYVDDDELARLERFVRLD